MFKVNKLLFKIYFKFIDEQYNYNIWKFQKAVEEITKQ